MFCYNCGTQFSEQYCQNCGTSTHKELSEYKTTFDSPKFCVGCGTELAGAYCASCGKSRSVPKISLAKKIMPAWPKAENAKPQGAPSASANYVAAADVVMADPGPTLSRQAIQYWLTAIFVLMPLLSLMSPILFGNRIPVILPNLLILFFASGVVAAPFIAKGNAKTEHYVYGATAGFCLLFDVFALAKDAMPGFAFFLTLLPIVMLGYHCVSHWNYFSLPPALKAFLDAFRGVRIIWLFYICYQVGDIILYFFEGQGGLLSLFHLAVLALISAAAYLLETGDRSKFKLAVSLLLGGCALQFLVYAFFYKFMMGIPFSSYFYLIIGSLIQVGIAIYIGKNVFATAAASLGKTAASAASAIPSGNSGSAAPDFVAANVPRPYGAKSSFTGGVGGLIGPKLAKAFTAVLFVVAFFGIAALIRETAPVIIVGILLLGIYAICAAYFDMMIYRWEIVNTTALGEPLSFNATVGSYIGLKFKIYLLTLITFGLYTSLGFAAVSIRRWKYRNSATPGSAQSDFKGKWYQYLGYSLAITFGGGFVIGVVSMLSGGTLLEIITGSISSIFDIGNLVMDPGGFIGDIISDMMQQIAITALVLPLLSTFISAISTFVFARWEISNAVVGGVAWDFKGTFMDAIGVVLINVILSAITFGLYSVLGFAHVRVTRYKMSNIV